jgi:hypothetical protein
MVLASSSIIKRFSRCMGRSSPHFELRFAQQADYKPAESLNKKSNDSVFHRYHNDRKIKLKNRIRQFPQYISHACFPCFRAVDCATAGAMIPFSRSL